MGTWGKGRTTAPCPNLGTRSQEGLLPHMKMLEQPLVTTEDTPVIVQERGNCAVVRATPRSTGRVILGRYPNVSVPQFLVCRVKNIPYLQGYSLA